MDAGRLESESVTVDTESTNHAHSDIGQIGVFAKILAGIHIRQMNFDEWQAGGEEGVAYRDTGVGIGSRVDNDEFDLVIPGLLDAIDNLAFAIRLEGLQCYALLTGHASQILVDLSECVGAIDFRFACTQQVQVGAMDDQNVSHLSKVFA